MKTEHKVLKKLSELRHPSLRSQVASMPPRFLYSKLCAHKKGPSAATGVRPVHEQTFEFRRDLQHHTRNTSFGGGEVATICGAQTGTTRLRRLVQAHAETVRRFRGRGEWVRLATSIRPRENGRCSLGFERRLALLLTAIL